MAGQRWGVGAATLVTISNTAIVGGLLLIPAGLIAGGTWVWWRGLALVAVYGVVNEVGNIMLAVWRVEHLRVRQQSVVASPDKRQPRIDAIGSALLLVAGAAWLVFLPVDIFRLHLLPTPAPWISFAGGTASLIGAGLTPLAAWENRFATPNVQRQEGQTIVTSGVYSVIRHPIYLGNLLLTSGASLWLGSYAGLWCFSCLLAATVMRIRIEERDLRVRLPDYADYQTKVPARLIPFII